MGAIGKILGSVFSTGAKDVIGSIGTVIDNVVTTKEEKELLKIEIAKEVNRHVESLQDKALRETELEFNDLDSARRRQVELAKAGAADRTPSILAYIAVIGFIGIVVFLMVHGISTMDKEIILLIGSLLGMLGSNSQTVYNYYFGSSSGSKEKQRQLSAMQVNLDKEKDKENEGN